MAHLLIALIIDILYSLSHVLGITDNSHFFIGFLMVAITLVGSFLAVFNGTLGAILLVLALVVFFLIFHLWALLLAPFFVIAALLAYVDHSRKRRAVLV